MRTKEPRQPRQPKKLKKLKEPKEPKEPRKPKEFVLAAAHFAAGIDDFGRVLDGLMRQAHSFPAQTNERALALFQVIEWCVLNGQPVPVRIGMELLTAFHAFMGLDKAATTLDAALGLRRPLKRERGAGSFDFPSGVSVAATIVEMVERRKAAGEAVDDDLFGAVGRALRRPMSGGSVKTAYYDNRGALPIFLERKAQAQRAGRDAADARENQEAAKRLRARISKKRQNS